MGRGASYDAPLGQSGSTQVFAGGRVAAMPSVGLKQKLGVAVLAAALFVLSASAASAREAWVWACHGPNGSPIGTQMTTGHDGDATAVANCAGPDNQGATLSLGATPAGRSHADLSIQ